MKDKIRIPAGTVVAFLIGGVLLLLAILIALPNNIRVKGPAGRPTMSLDSGVDKKSSYSGSSYPSTSAERTATPQASPESSASGQAASASAQTARRISGRVRAGLDTSRLQSWLMPQAYAEDHNLSEEYLIRTADCRIVVDDYRKAADGVTAIAAKYGGMVSDSQSQRQADNYVEGWITLRVPNRSFFSAWAEALSIGEVLDESVTTQDVSQDYVGGLSRLKNLLAEQAALQRMLDEALAVQRARGLGEGYKILLDTQDRLFNVTGDIESTEDQLNALADKITRSTITVRLSERKTLPVQAQEKFTWGMGNVAGGAYRDLLVSVRGLLHGLTYFLITCWTWVIPLLILGLIGRSIYRRYVAPRPGLELPAPPAAPSSPSAQ